MDDEKRELEQETKLLDDVDVDMGSASGGNGVLSGSNTVEELEEGQVPWAEANGTC